MIGCRKINENAQEMALQRSYKLLSEIDSTRCKDATRRKVVLTDMIELHCVLLFKLIKGVYT